MKLTLTTVLFLSFLYAVNSVSESYFERCRGLQCDSIESSCAQDTVVCMNIYIAQYNCFETNSECTSLTESEPFGTCWKQCEEPSTASRIYTALTQCYESCGAADYSSVLSLSLVTVILSTLLFLF